MYAREREAPMAQPTYTVDSRMNGKFYSDYGVTAEQVAAARVNAPKMGVEIIAVVEEVPVQVEALEAFGVVL